MVFMATCRCYFRWFLQGCLLQSFSQAAPQGSTPPLVSQGGLPRSAMAGRGSQQAATPQSTLARGFTEAHQQLGLQQNITNQPVYTANQQLWFQQRQDKRKAPSASGSMLGTPQVPESDATMEEEHGTDPFATATPQQTGQGANLFQPMPMQEQTAYSLAAAQLGVDINDPAAVQAWLTGQVTTRADVLQTGVPLYHHGVIRPELFHYISQVENVAKTLDDRIAQNQEARKGFAG